MISFQVEDMSCSHCVNAITQAVKQADAQAVVHIDLPAHRVDIESNRASPGQLADAIRDAGYTPVAA